MHSNQLGALGWSAFQQKQLDQSPIDAGCTVGRIVEVQRDLVLVADGHSDFWAALAGRFRYDAMMSADFPAVGDWAVVRRGPGDERGVLTGLLERKSKFARKAPQTGFEQTLAANVDLALIVAAAGHDLNLRRIERYLAMVWESGAAPAIVITKSDKSPDIDSAVAEVESISPGVRVLATSAVSGDGINALRTLIRPGETAVLLGSSGVGKSTLVNAPVGREVQLVSQVSNHQDKGRHTTTSRKLITLQDGGMIIDTPGMRELQLLDVEDGVAQTFEDVEQIIARCRFTDCQHRTEPGCAVREALQSGQLDADRYASYRKLQREAAYEARQSDARLMRAEKEVWKKRSQQGLANMRRKRLW